MSVLSVKGLTRLFGDLVAVDDVSFSIEKGSIFGFIGPNGAGKTTIFNMVTGVYVPTEGTVSFKSDRIDGLEPHVINQLGIARTFQNIRLFPNLTVLDNVSFAYHPHAHYGIWDVVTRTARFEENAFGRGKNPAD